MIVDRVLLQFQVGVGSASDSLSNPATFIRRISAYDGSTLLKSWDVGAADFNKDSSDRYYAILSGLRFLVPKDATKVLTFNIDVIGVSADQSSRYVTVKGYAGNTQNVRAVDGAGLNSYTDQSSDSRVQIFTTSGTSALTVTLNSGLTPKSTNNRVSTSDGIKKLTMQVIDVKSETGASVIKNMNVYVHATATAGLPSTLYLYDGSTMLGSASVASDVNDDVNFTDLNLVIPQDTTKQLTIKADFASTVGGQAASTSVPTNGIKWEKPDSTTASTSPTSALTSNDQYLYTAIPQWTLVSQSMTAASPGATNATSSITGTLVLKAKALGGAMTKPVASDFNVVFASTTVSNGAYVGQISSGANALVVGTPDSISVSPSDATVGDGGEYVVTITTTLTSATTSINGSSGRTLFMAVQNIDSVVGGNTITNQTWGINDFYTDAKFLPK